MKLPISILIAGVLFTGAFWMADSLASSQKEKADAPAKTEAKAAPETAANKPVPHVEKRPKAELLVVQDKDVIVGDKAAPVTIFEYSSLSCPHCAHFHKDVLPTLKKEYIDTGKAKLVVRQFPLNAPALNGALLVNCLPPERAAKFVHVLFKLQERWAYKIDNRAALQKIAAVGGVSEEQFNACLDDKESEEALLQNYLVSRDSLEIASTPTFFIGDAKIEGAREVSVFADAIARAAKDATAKKAE